MHLLPQLEIVLGSSWLANVRAGGWGRCMLVLGDGGGSVPVCVCVCGGGGLFSVAHLGHACVVF